MGDADVMVSRMEPKAVRRVMDGCMLAGCVGGSGNAGDMVD